jgi:hypothetical protein
MVRVVTEFLDAVEASVRGIFGEIFRHGGQENSVDLNERFCWFLRSNEWMEFTAGTYALEQW